MCSVPESHLLKFRRKEHLLVKEEALTFGYVAWLAMWLGGTKGVDLGGS